MVESCSIVLGSIPYLWVSKRQPDLNSCIEDEGLPDWEVVSEGEGRVEEQEEEGVPAQEGAHLGEQGAGVSQELTRCLYAGLISSSAQVKMNREVRFPENISMTTKNLNVTYEPQKFDGGQ